MTEQTQSPPGSRKSRGWLWGVLITIGVIVLGVGGGTLWWKSQFPYGNSHSCSKGLGVALRLYAHDHEGWFPYGGNTAEASLSMVCSNDSTAHMLLRGKHLSQKTVDEALAKDGVLGPDSCGWHYVEGLRENDDGNIAVAWDKMAGLDHHGRKRAGFMHEVLLLDGSNQFIRAEKWEEFVKRQKELLAEVAAKRPTNSPPIRWSDEEVLGPNRQKPAR